MTDSTPLAVIVGFFAGITLVVSFAIFLHSIPISIVKNRISNQISTIIIPQKVGDPENNFEPQILKVMIGVNNTVRWINQDSVINWVSADNLTDPSFYAAAPSILIANGTSNNVILPGHVFEYTFTQLGKIGYHGKPWQRGIVQVLPLDQ